MNLASTVSSSSSFCTDSFSSICFTDEMTMYCAKLACKSHIHSPIIGTMSFVFFQFSKRVFDLVKDFGTSESPKSTRSSTTHWCPGRPGHPAFRHNIASSLRLHTGLPYDWTPRSDAPLGSPLAPSARRVSRVASRLPGTTRLRFALHGGQRAYVRFEDISTAIR